MRSKSAPELRALPAPRGPFGFQPRAVGIQRALPGAKNIRRLTLDDASHKATAPAGAPNDLFDRNPVLGERHDHRVGLFASKITLVLKRFRAGQQARVDDRCADRGADVAHRFAHRVQEGGARVLEQMPTVSDLHRVRKDARGSVAIAATTITRQNIYLGMGGEPRCDGCSFAVRQQRYNPPPFEIDDDRPIAMVATESPVIDTSHDQGLPSWMGMPAHNPKKSVVAYGHHEPRRESRRRTSAQRKTEVMDEAFQPCGSSRTGGEIGLVEALGEDASRACRRLATKAARHDTKMDGASRTGKVRDLPDVTAMDPPRGHTTGGARC